MGGSTDMKEGEGWGSDGIKGGGEEWSESISISGA